MLVFKAALRIGLLEFCQCHQNLSLCWNTNKIRGLRPVSEKIPQLEVYSFTPQQCLRNFKWMLFKTLPNFEKYIRLELLDINEDPHVIQQE